MQYTVILQTTLHSTRPSVFFDLLLSIKPKLQITYCSLEKKVNQRICFVHIEMVKMGTFSCSKEVSVWISSLLSTDSTETELIYSKFKNTIFFGSITIFYYSTFFPPHPYNGSYCNPHCSCHPKMLHQNKNRHPYWIAAEGSEMGCAAKQRCL